MISVKLNDEHVEGSPFKVSRRKPFEVVKSISLMQCVRQIKSKLFRLRSSSEHQHQLQLRQTTTRAL